MIENIDNSETFEEIYNKENHNEIDETLKLTVNGGVTVMSKSAFTDGDIQHIYYETVFAEQIAKNNIQRFIPNSFFIAKTKRYLLYLYCIFCYKSYFSDHANLFLFY